MVKNLIFIIFVLFLAGDLYAAGNSPKIVAITPSIIENVSPEAIFDQIRGFLTFSVPNLNISAPTLKMPGLDTSGIRNLNNQIRDITGVDIFQFLRFLWDLFLAIVHYLLELPSRTAG